MSNSVGLSLKAGTLLSDTGIRKVWESLGLSGIVREDAKNQALS